MLCLTDLEPEVVALILEFVDDTSPHSTKAVACVNRYLNQLTKFISHRHKGIDVQGAFEGDIVELVRGWTDDEIILANIKSLTVTGRIDDTFSDDEDEEDDGSSLVNVHTDDETAWKPLASFISKIGRLRQFDWVIACAMPMCVFEALEKHQRFSKLRVFNFKRKSTYIGGPEPIELRLAESPALTHIRHAETVMLHNDQPPLSPLAFRAIVASAPNLEYAGMIASPRELLQDGQPSAELERWRADFNSHQTPNQSVKQLTLDGFPMNQQTLADWGTTVDLGSLENIKFSRGTPTVDYFRYAISALSNLKHLSLNLRGIILQIDETRKDEIAAAARDYITSCPPLHTLSLWSWIDIVPLSGILQRHSASLRTLQLHERESNDMNGWKILSLSDIKTIRASCPNLKSFTFDLLRHNQKLRPEQDDNLPYYEELGQFEHLNTLQIYFDVGQPWLAGVRHLTHANDNTDQADATGSPSSSPPPAKRMRRSEPIPPSDEADFVPYVEHIWTKVFGHRANARRLDVKVGDWESTDSPFSSVKALKRHFIVRPHERDDVRKPTVLTRRKVHWE